MNAPAWTAALLCSSDQHVAGVGLSLAPRGKGASAAAGSSFGTATPAAVAVSARRRAAVGWVAMRAFGSKRVSWWRMVL
jgi:hypothetical protein